MTDDAPIGSVRDYHERTKHRPGRYARSLGYLDWDNQPSPFRRYAGAPRFHLEEVPVRGGPSFAALGDLPAAPLDRAFLAQLLYDSLALSAWKAAGPRQWSLRCNPSSGNLHPTEGHVLAGPVPGLRDRPALYHYTPLDHALEHRADLPTHLWRTLTQGRVPGTLFAALTSIHVRESWKYGERAYRYCQLDVGHAIAALAYAAAAQGWATRLVEGIADKPLARLLGIHDQRGAEAEHPDALLALSPESLEGAAPPLQLGPQGVPDLDLAGEPVALGGEHHPWPVLDQVTRLGGEGVEILATESPGSPRPGLPWPDAPRARDLFHERRSAMDMDGETSIDVPAFRRLLEGLLPGRVPHDTLPWRPAVDLVLFVHRVDGLQSGLYLLTRDESGAEALRGELSGRFLWHPVEGMPGELVLLEAGDVRTLARGLSCVQDIAADGVMTVAMLAQFDPRITAHGEGFYRRLLWECGLIGQALYLGAEAVGLRGTGIGCFFDDLVHDWLGLEGTVRQVLYHFTVGAPVDDPRLQTLPPYHHRRGMVDPNEGGGGRG